MLNEIQINKVWGGKLAGLILGLFAILLFASDFLIPEEAKGDATTLTATVATTVSCTTAGSPSAFGTITTASIVTSTPNTTTTLTCNPANGCTLNVKDGGNGTNPGLTTTPTYIIGSADSSYGNTATLAAGTEGYGIQAVTTSAGSGTVTPLIYTRYKQTGQAVGGFEITNQGLASSSAPISGREIAVTHFVAISGLTGGGTYQDIVTYSCAAN
jgi:hypothetical protein